MQTVIYSTKQISIKSNVQLLYLWTKSLNKAFNFRERITSDARAVAVRQHDETVIRTRVSSKQEQSSRQEVIKSEHRTRKDEKSSRRDDNHLRKEDQNVRREDIVKKEERREGILYKRGELISSARTRPTWHIVHLPAFIHKRLFIILSSFI